MRGPLQQNETRHAELVAAAEVLRDWIHTRRAMWAPDTPPPAAASSVLDAAVWSDQRWHPRLDPSDSPTGDLRAEARIPFGALRSMAAPFLQSPRRLAACAGILVLVVGGWTVRPYFTSLTTRLSKLTTTARTGTAVLESLPDGAEVLIDGKALGETPLTIDLQTGHHVVEFRRRDASRKMEIEVPAGRLITSRVDWTVVPTGYLTVRSEPAGARVSIDGQPRGTTPLTVSDLKVGPHVVVLENDEGSVRRAVQVTSDTTAVVSESIYAGWLKLFVPFPVEITEGSRVLRLDEQSQILIAPGVHELHIQSLALGYRETRRVEVNPGRTTALSLIPPPSTLTVTASMPATVLIDGQRVGDIPLADQPIALGTREIVVRSATGAERRYTREVTVAPLRIDVDFSKP